MYFYVSGGRSVRLEEIGHIEAIKSLYAKQYLPLFIAQIKSNALPAPKGRFNDGFEKSYDFYDVLYSYRQSGVRGRFEGVIIETATGARRITGNAQIYFFDEFKDPLEIAQTTSLLTQIIPGIPDISEAESPELLKHIAQVAGAPYVIEGEWSIAIDESL